MAVNGTHDTGEEFKQKSIFRQDAIGTRPTTVEVGLYNDATDALAESDDVGAITTEPTTGNYTRQTLSLDTSDLSLSVDGAGDLSVEGTVSFDVTDTGETVDAYFLTVSFESDVVNSETTVNDHLLVSATFNGGSEDLSNSSAIDVTISDTLS
jgi:hypothetical protein